ncbi:MAG: hypothetical protein E7419_00070 [Ruminococcaceae bacterium]|nr:hypothetical protein [Oscillospiraceae bacterium]
MKKLLSLILVCTLVISFGATVFADTYIRYTFYDNTDGYTYHFGAFDSDDTDAGVIINGKEYTLQNADKNDSSKTAFEVAKENGNIFGIGFKTADSFKDDSYVVTPYSKDAEGNLVTGQGITVSANPSTTPVVNEKAYAVTDDFYNENSTMRTDYTYLMVRTDGLYGPSSVANLSTAILKLDLTKFKDAAEESNFILYLKGRASYHDKDSVSPGFDSAKVQVCSTSQEWSESDLSSFTEASLLNQITNRNSVIDTVTITTSDTLDWYKLNITSLIQQELAKGSESVSIALYCDNTEAEALSKVDGKRNALKFAFYSKTGEEPPYIEYQKVDPSYTSADLETLTINGKEIDVADFDETGSMTVKLSYGVTVDSILATASGNYATVSNAVKVDDDTYTVAVTAGNGTEKTYTINFEWVAPSSLAEVSFGELYLQQRSTYMDSAMDDANMLKTKYPDTLTSNLHVTGMKGDVTKVYGGKTTYPGVALIELDLSKLENLDTTKETTLNIYGRVYSYSADDNADVIVSFYDATGTDMDAVTIEDIRNISKWVSDDKLLDTTTLKGRNTSYNKTEFIPVSLTGVIEKYYGTGKNPIIALYIGVPETNTDPRARLQLYKNEISKTTIKYYKFDN